MSREVIHPDGRISYRTKVMDPEQAARFAKCLAGNPRFCDVLIHPSERTKTEKHFVTFRPANTERQAELYMHQHEARRNRAAVEGLEYLFWKDLEFPGSWWCFNPNSGETYQVEVFHCSCPDYQYRCNRAGLQCKHMHALELQSKFGLLEPSGKSSESREEKRARILKQIGEDF